MTCLNILINIYTLAQTNPQKFVSLQVMIP